MRYQRTREAKRTDSVDAVFHHRFIRNHKLVYVYSSSSVRVPFLSLFPLSLSLSRARKKKKNERDQKTNEGKCAHAHTQTQARARKGENRIRSLKKQCFYHSRLTQNRSESGRFCSSSSRSFASLNALPQRARFLCILRPSPHVFFFSFLRARKSDTLKI